VPAVQNAFKAYVRTRDYCTSPKHIMTMCLNAVRVAVEMNNFMHVTNYVNKAEQTPGTKVRPVTSCVCIACGHCLLGKKPPCWLVLGQGLWRQGGC
jgi:COP9 signalosome complex subunit 1